MMDDKNLSPPVISPPPKSLAQELQETCDAAVIRKGNEDFNNVVKHLRGAAQEGFYNVRFSGRAAERFFDHNNGRQLVQRLEKEGLQVTLTQENRNVVVRIARTIDSEHNSFQTELPPYPPVLKE